MAGTPGADGADGVDGAPGLVPDAACPLGEMPVSVVAGALDCQVTNVLRELDPNPDAVSVQFLRGHISGSVLAFSGGAQDGDEYRFFLPETRVVNVQMISPCDQPRQAFLEIRTPFGSEQPTTDQNGCLTITRELGPGTYSIRVNPGVANQVIRYELVFDAR